MPRPRGCAGGSGDSGPPTPTWYINPDSGGQAEIASRCTQAAGGASTIETALLPREAGAQREQLIRRLAADDDSIDLMSLDPPLIPESAEAGFLAPIPEDLADRATRGVVASAVAGVLIFDPESGEILTRELVPTSDVASPGGMRSLRPRPGMARMRSPHARRLS